MVKIANYDFKVIEEGILKFWSDNKIYEKAKKKNAKGKEFYFLDGPPYTSGKIHLGHAWNKSMKDAVLRYKRMQGLNVWDRAGYDMHGLPTEQATEKKLGIHGKEEIEKFGVNKFIEECRDLCIHYMHEMNKDFKRLGVWMDFENAYQPIDSSFIEGEWWLIKKAHENGRLYEGLRTVTWCANDGTALAKHELEYKTITEPSIYLKFPIVGTKNEFLIVWTTTPWTIPFNEAVMVNPDVDYVKAKVDDEIWIVAKALTAFIPATAEKKFEIIEEFKGTKLEGMKYKHPLADEIKLFKEIEKSSPKLHTVLLSEEYVDTSAGSGLVHCAPGCGPEDYEVGHRNGLPPFNELNEHGIFSKSMGKFAGWKAKVDDKKFIEELERKGVLIAVTPVEHEYAHCWRCKNPVIYRTTKQWFFKVEDLKENMRELNKSIKWVPDYAGSRQFDSWLANLRDNSITRQRYWGVPAPIWKCECGNYEVIGSRKELKDKTGKLPEDLHKPFVDELIIKCKKCGKNMKRIPDVLDVWIDSSTTSWNCLNYPQEQKLFKKMFPPDFILEGIDQIRGWFNILFVSSMIAMQKPAYKAVYMHGFINDSEARKMSKSLGNIIEPQSVISQYGADALRYYLIGSANPGLDLNYSIEEMKIKQKNLLVLWNLHKFLAEYQTLIGKTPNEIKPKLDLEEKYILSKMNSAIQKATEAFEDYRINEIPLIAEDLFLELSRTYIQLVREKSATGADEEKETILYTLYNVLVTCLKLLAPITPFITEQIYLNLKEQFGLKESSIHLTKWPKVDKKAINAKLEQNMEFAKQTIQSILSAREKAQLGVRWPLADVVVVSEDEKIRDAIIELQDLIKTQTNVKKIDVQPDFVGVRKTMKPDYNKINPEFKENTPFIIAQLAMQSKDAIAKHLEKEGKFILKADGKQFELKKDHFIIESVVAPPYLMSSFRNGEVYINTQLTKELEAEGFARELTRRIQELRKKSRLQKQNEIELFISCDLDMKDMLMDHLDMMKQKVGAKSISFKGKGNISNKEKIKNKEIEISFNVVN